MMATEDTDKPCFDKNLLAFNEEYCGNGCVEMSDGVEAPTEGAETRIFTSPVCTKCDECAVFPVDRSLLAANCAPVHNIMCREVVVASPHTNSIW